MDPYWVQCQMEGKSNFSMWKLTSVSQVIEVNVSSNKTFASMYFFLFDVIKWYFTSVIFFQTYNLSLIMRKVSDKSKLVDNIQNFWLVLKIIKAVKNKESLRKYHSQEELKETW